MLTKHRNQLANRYADDILIMLYKKINNIKEPAQVPPAWVKAHHKDVEHVLREFAGRVEGDSP